MRKLILILTTLVLIALVLTLSPSPARAQNDPATTWYWATTPEGLVAYNADGDVNLIFQEGELLNVSLSGYRFANDSALLQKGEDFYWATSDSAQKFPIELSAAIHDLHPIDFKLPYLLMGSPQSSVTSIVLDIENFQAIPLSGNILIPRFLPNGQTLRYVTYQREDEQIVGTALWEINLATGHQRILHQRDRRPNTIYCTPDGQNWWFIYNFQIEDPSATEVITIGEPSPEYTQWIQSGTAYIIDDWLFHDLPCPRECSTEPYLLTEQPPIRFQLAKNPYLSRGLYHFADDSLWLSNLLAAELLDSSGKTYYLGQTIVVAGPEYSRDGRWAISLGPSTNPSEFYRTLNIWYLPYREIIFQVQFAWIWSITVQFFENTVLVNMKDSYTSTNFAFVGWRDYDYQIGFSNVTVRDLPGEFFQALADGNVLFVAPQSGIFRYDAATGSSNEIVPDGQPIILHELE